MATIHQFPKREELPGTGSVLAVSIMAAFWFGAIFGAFVEWLVRR